MDMLMNLLSHLLALDIGWIIGLIMGNIFWVFAFLMLAFIFAPHRWLAFFMIFILSVYGWLDMTTLTGWSFLVAGFLLLNYILKIVTVGFIENSPLPKNYIVIANELGATLLWIWFGIFILGGGG